MDIGNSAERTILQRCAPAGTRGDDISAAFGTLDAMNNCGRMSRHGRFIAEFPVLDLLLSANGDGMSARIKS